MAFRTISMSILALAATMSTGVHARSGGYAGTCSQAEVITEPDTTPQGWYLQAYCGNGHGGYNWGNLWLGGCIGNSGGNLVYQPGGAFGNSCNNIGLSGTYLHADCGNGRGGYQYTQIDLNTIAGNSGGNLVC